MTEPTTPEPHDLAVGDYVWHTPAGQRPAGQVVGRQGPDGVWVHWLNEDPRRIHPIARADLTYATPNPSNPIVGDDGEPIPPELQPGGQLWLAIADGLHRTHSILVHGYVDTIAARLAPPLWPWLPSNPDSAEAGAREHRAEVEAVLAEADARDRLRGDITNDGDSNTPAGPPAAAGSTDGPAG